MAELLDRAIHLDNLRFAWYRVEANRGKAGGDGVTISRFAYRLEHNLLTLAEDVRSGAYRPGPPRRVRVVSNGKSRTLDVLPIRDRVLQRAVLDVLTPRLDPTFLPSSYGYRVGRSIKDAVARIVHLRDRGLSWVVDADIADCFPSFDHDLMDRFLGEAIPDDDLHRLLTGWVRAPRSAAGNTRSGGYPPRRGIVLGAPVSPLLCNLYLHHLDRSLRRRGYQTVRYADDFIVLCKSRAHAEYALRATEKVVHGLELALNPRKTRVVDFADGFDFLGVRFEGDDYSYLADGKRVVVDDLPPAWFHYHADPYE